MHKEQSHGQHRHATRDEETPGWHTHEHGAYDAAGEHEHEHIHARGREGMHSHEHAHKHTYIHKH